MALWPCAAMAPTSCWYLGSSAPQLALVQRPQHCALKARVWRKGAGNATHAQVQLSRGCPAGRADPGGPPPSAPPAAQVRAAAAGGAGEQGREGWHHHGSAEHRCALLLVCVCGGRGRAAEWRTFSRRTATPRSRGAPSGPRCVRESSRGRREGGRQGAPQNLRTARSVARAPLLACMRAVVCQG